MPPEDHQHRLTVRFSDEDWALVELAASQGGMAMSGLVRECAVRYGFQVARDRLAGKAVKVRAPNGSPRPRSSAAKRERRLAAEAEARPARTPLEPVEAFALAAQRRLAG